MPGRFFVPQTWLLHLKCIMVKFEITLFPDRFNAVKYENFRKEIIADSSSGNDLQKVLQLIMDTAERVTAED
jgi:hypothetical protein